MFELDAAISHSSYFTGFQGSRLTLGNQTSLQSQSRGIDLIRNITERDPRLLRNGLVNCGEATTWYAAISNDVL